jgi:hypothetical protein
VRKVKSWYDVGVGSSLTEDKKMAPAVRRTPRSPAHRKGPTVDEISVRAGDPFVAAAKRRPPAQATHDETPHGCYDGWLFFGVEDDVEEKIECVPCRRCQPVSKS